MEIRYLLRYYFRFISFTIMVLYYLCHDILFLFFAITIAVIALITITSINAASRFYNHNSNDIIHRTTPFSYMKKKSFYSHLCCFPLTRETHK